MAKARSSFIVSETTQLHDMTTEVYEHMMDEENVEAIGVLDKIAEKVRMLKADLLTKEL